MWLHKLGQVDAAVDILSVKTTSTMICRMRKLEGVANIFKVNTKRKTLKKSVKLLERD